MMSSVAQPPSSLPFVSPQFFILLLLIFFLEILAIMLFFIYQDEVRRLDGSHWVTSSCYSPQRTMLKRDSVSVRLCFRGVFVSVNHIVCWFSIEHIHWHFFLQHWFSTIYMYFFLLSGIFGEIFMDELALWIFPYQSTYLLNSNCFTLLPGWGDFGFIMKCRSRYPDVELQRNTETCLLDSVFLHVLNGR